MYTFTKESTLHEVALCYAMQSIDHETQRGVFAPYLLRYVQDIFGQLDSHIDTAAQFRKEMEVEEKFFIDYEKDNILFTKSARTLKGNNAWSHCFKTIMRGLEQGVDIMAVTAVRTLADDLIQLKKDGVDKNVELQRTKEAETKAAKVCIEAGVNMTTVEGQEILKAEIENQVTIAKDKLIARDKASKLDSSRRIAAKELSNLPRDSIIALLADVGISGDDVPAAAQVQDEFDILGQELAKETRAYHASKLEEFGDSEGAQTRAMNQATQVMTSAIDKAKANREASVNALKAKLFDKTG